MGIHTCFDCGIEFESKRDSVHNIYCGANCSSRCMRRVSRGWLRGDLAKILRYIQKFPNATAKDIIATVDKGLKPFNVKAKFNNCKISKGFDFLVNKELVIKHYPPNSAIQYEIIGGDSLDEWINPRFLK